MSDEWERVGEYIERLVCAAPAKLKVSAQSLQSSFEVAKAARNSAAQLFEDLLLTGTLTEEAAEIWSEHKHRHYCRWRDLFASAGQLEARIQRQSKRGRSEHNDHDLDRQVARLALSKARLDKLALAPAIRQVAKELGVMCLPSTEAFLKRIRRLINDPTAGIDQDFTTALQSYLRDKYGKDFMSFDFSET